MLKSIAISKRKPVGSTDELNASSKKFLSNSCYELNLTKYLPNYPKPNKYNISKSMLFSNRRNFDIKRSKSFKKDSIKGIIKRIIIPHKIIYKRNRYFEPFKSNLHSRRDFNVTNYNTRNEIKVIYRRI